MPDLGTLISSRNFITAPYWGQVSNHCYVHAFATQGNKQLMSRSPHRAKGALTALKLVIANWFWDRSGNQTEKGQGGTATVTASIEYPVGTFTQVLFGGATSKTVVDGDEVLSDATTVSIPNGAQFFVRIWFSGSNGIVYGDQADNFNGQALTYGNTVTDQTMGGTVANSGSVPAAGAPNNSAPSFGPLAILGLTSQPSVLIVGDSRANGFNDVYDASGDVGEIARSVGAAYGYINAGCYGDQISNFVTSHANRVALAQFCSHVICQAGTNDMVVGGASLTTMKQNMTALWNYYGPRRPVFHTTIAARTTSTDNWATVANQTPVASEPTRVSVNDWLRSLPFGLDGYFEMADAVESARNSGRWKANGSAFGYTGDGVHESGAGYVAMQTAGGLNPTTILR